MQLRIFVLYMPKRAMSIPTMTKEPQIRTGIHKDFFEISLVSFIMRSYFSVTVSAVSCVVSEKIIVTDSTYSKVFHLEFDRLLNHC